MTAPMPYTREELQEFAYDTSGAYMTEDGDTLELDRVEATVEALDTHRSALRGLVRVVSNQLARGENEPGDFEAAWKRAVELTKEKP